MGTMNKKVYLLEDDTSICELVQCALEMSGIELSAYNTVYEFWAALEKSAFPTYRFFLIWLIALFSRRETWA